MNLIGNISCPVRLPAEWEPVEAVWISWPHNPNTWPGRFQYVPAAFQNWAEQLADVVPLRILIGQDAPIPDSVRRNQKLELVDIPTNDCWIRDYGPTFVEISTNKALIGIDWRYNAWGAKYPPWDQDDLVASRLCEHAQLRSQTETICLEGGAIETDGLGRLLTSPRCLANPNRNPGLGRRSLEKALNSTLGLREVAWIDTHLEGDDTDGHIDQIARFIDPQNVVVAVCDDPADTNYRPLQCSFEQLKAWSERTTPSVKLHRLPIPPARFIDGQRLPESYCNFLRLGSDCLHVPSFGVPTHDDYAADLLRELSGVEVVSIDCRELVWGLGALHCASLNQPVGCYQTDVRHRSGQT